MHGFADSGQDAFRRSAGTHTDLHRIPGVIHLLEYRKICFRHGRFPYPAILLVADFAHDRRRLDLVAVEKLPRGNLAGPQGAGHRAVNDGVRGELRQGSGPKRRTGSPILAESLSGRCRPLNFLGTEIPSG